MYAPCCRHVATVYDPVSEIGGPDSVLSYRGHLRLILRSAIEYNCSLMETAKDAVSAAGCPVGGYCAAVDLRRGVARLGRPACLDLLHHQWAQGLAGPGIDSRSAAMRNDGVSSLDEARAANLR